LYLGLETLALNELSFNICPKEKVLAKIKNKVIRKRIIIDLLLKLRSQQIYLCREFT
jgi:hypothetical protein